MCDDARTPHLRTYTVRFRNSPDEYYADAKIRAQGVRWNVDADRVELWRRIEAGAEQSVGVFRLSDVLGVFDDADDAALTVPDGWQAAHLGGEVFSQPESVPPVSDDDVPF